MRPATYASPQILCEGPGEAIIGDREAKVESIIGRLKHAGNCAAGGRAKALVCTDECGISGQLVPEIEACDSTDRVSWGDHVGIDVDETQFGLRDLRGELIIEIFGDLNRNSIQVDLRPLVGRVVTSGLAEIARQPRGTHAQ